MEPDRHSVEGSHQGPLVITFVTTSSGGPVAQMVDAGYVAGAPA